jgi:hypothetical protein
MWLRSGRADDKILLAPLLGSMPAAGAPARPAGGMSAAAFDRGR